MRKTVSEQKKMETIIDSHSQGTFYHRQLAQLQCLRNYRNRITICLVWAQLEYWFFKLEGRPFYKFVAPSDNDIYKEGDSWCEELVISEKEFRRASQVLCTRYKTKTQFDAVKPFEEKFKGLPYCCYTDRRTGKTWYFRNHRLLDPFFKNLLSSDNTVRQNKKSKTKDALGLTEVEQKNLSQNQGQSHANNSERYAPDQREGVHLPKQQADLNTENTQETKQEITHNIELDDSNTTDKDDDVIDAELVDPPKDQLVLLPELESKESETENYSEKLSKNKNNELKQLLNPVIELYNSNKPINWSRKKEVSLEGYFKKGTTRYNILQALKQLREEGYDDLIGSIKCALVGANHNEFYSSRDRFQLEWFLRLKNFNPLFEQGQTQLEKQWNREAVVSGKPKTESSSKQEREIKMWVTYLSKINPDSEELPPESIRERVFARLS